ncbi:type I restriction endonuclease [Rhodocyclus tenuis]|uniref:Restriction endonuclease type I HsdR N-terminal domain-containing protein n=1 Tax=Rhodocyclus tenuis TaxID=1066 RepID=A0A840G237_RHOTE|nr:type I restriction endonuclease [Rhodocyclus tenuis]MBB4248364.1 hypothetical protein [Rhodocyclus tenuis]
MEFAERMKSHIAHVRNVSEHCDSEETTKQALILPVLDALGFSPFDPLKVRAEFAADFPGVKFNERVDYSLFCNGVPVMFIEAKSVKENLTNHAPQLSRYFNSVPEVTIAAITNGREWRFFTDLVAKNVMDKEPFLVVDFSRISNGDIEQLARFRHDQFQPDALRTLAEESVYLAAFKDVIKKSVLDCSDDFVRFVANHSSIQRTLTVRFVEAITPIVKQAVAQSMSERVAHSFAEPVTPAAPDQPAAASSVEVSATDDYVDPHNPRIVTTEAERRIFAIVSDIVGDAAELVGKDTETYYSVLYQGKVNRWLLRYFGARKNPGVQFCVPLTDVRLKEVARAGLQVGPGDAILLASPEHLSRIPGIVFDALEHARNDANFKRAGGDHQGA